MLAGDVMLVSRDSYDSTGSALMCHVETRCVWSVLSSPTEPLSKARGGCSGVKPGILDLEEPNSLSQACKCPESQNSPVIALAQSLAQFYFYPPYPPPPHAAYLCIHLQVLRLHSSDRPADLLPQRPTLIVQHN